MLLELLFGVVLFQDFALVGGQPVEVSQEADVRMVDRGDEEAAVDAVPEDAGVLLEAAEFYVFQLVGVLERVFEEVVLLVVVLGRRDLVGFSV